MTEETNVNVTEAQETEVNVNESQAEQMANVASYNKGDTVKGKIVKIEDNQALVDIGYKYDGIIPVRELSSVNLENAAEGVELGQEVECKILSINDEKETLLLSKRVIDSEQAWDSLQAKLESGEVLEAAVKEVVKGGLVVDIGVRGFVPASMVERHFVEDFSDYKGKTLRLKVKEVDKENNKVILSQKDVLEDEYNVKKQERISQLSIGEVIEGTVQRLTPFGVFVDIGGIDGLVHISELAWQHVQEPSEVVQEGLKVNVKVLKVDLEAERISLSIKQAQKGPWSDVNTTFNVGDIVQGQVKRLTTFGAFVEIAPGVEGLVHISQISHRHIGTPQEVLKEGQEVQVKILDINVDEKRISLSIKETEESPAPVEKPKREKEVKPSFENENVSLSNEGLSITLAERFGDKLKQFK